MMRRQVQAVAATSLAVMLGLGTVGCSSDRPSKEEYRDAMAAYAEKSGLIKSDSTLLDCVADEAYDDLSDEMLRSVVDNDDDRNVSKSDLSAVEEASKKCTDEILRGPEGDGSNPDAG